jgi:hypothetical protein
MWYPVEISFSSYLPDELEEGMLFINRISVGVIEPYIELFELEEIPEDMDEFMSKHGAPVDILIIDDGDIIASHDQIGWWDEGDDTDELRDITLDDINYILRELEGCVDIQIEDDDEDAFIPVMYEDKIVLSLVPDDDEEE